MISLWDKRIEEFGHTGWGNEVIYAFDQPIRLGIVDNLIKRYSHGGGNA